MIRRALGLGLMILILKFLMSEVFMAMENMMVDTLNTASTVMTGINQSGFNIQNLPLP
jgi:hypothetical protein